MTMPTLKRSAQPAPPERHHRQIQRGAARAAVLGVSDGLVTNISLILGFAGANTSPGLVRLAGVGGLLAGAFSMAAGEYVSMKAQSELLQRELDMEALELRRAPDAERAELTQLYESRGVDPAVASDMAAQMMRTPELALDTHAREELGVSPQNLGNPYAASTASAASFGAGALVPLVPWFFTSGGLALALSLVLGALAAVFIGIALARFSGRSPLRLVVRQLIVTIVAAGVTFLVGKAVGTNLT